MTAAPSSQPAAAGFSPQLSTVLNLTLKDLEEHLGTSDDQLLSMNVEDLLKQLNGTATLESLPSLLQAPSWMVPLVGQPQVPAAGQAPVQPSGPASLESAAQAAAAPTAQQQQPQEEQAAQQEAAARLGSMRMEDLYALWSGQQQQQAGTAAAAGKVAAQPAPVTVPPPDTTLLQLFDSAGLQFAPVPMFTQQPAGVAVNPAATAAGASTLPISYGTPVLPVGLTTAGPFACEVVALPVVPGLQAPALQQQQQQVAAQQAGTQQPTAGLPPRDASAARAARARKRKDMSSAPTAAPSAKAGLTSSSDGNEQGHSHGDSKHGHGHSHAHPLTAAEAAAQAKVVAERAAAELAELPDDLDEKEARAIKRAIKNRESAARSRAKRQEYTATLEQQVEALKAQNQRLREQVVTAAAAPPDPHAGKLDGGLLRRTRTGPV